MKPAANALSPKARAKIVQTVKGRWAHWSKKKTPAAKKADSSLPGGRLAAAMGKQEADGRLKSPLAGPIVPTGKLMELDPKTCRRSPWNREHFDPERMARMNKNVEKEGVLQNGIVRRNPGTTVTSENGDWVVRSNGGGMLIRNWGVSDFCEQAARKMSEELNQAEWEVIAGERRWTAALTTGRMFPAVERQANDIEALELQLAENSDREDLNALDEARKFEQLRAAYIGQGMTPGQAMQKLVERTELSDSTIESRLKLLELPAEVTTALEEGKLNASQAGLVTVLKTPEAQRKLAADILKPRQVWTSRGTAEEPISFREAKSLAEAARDDEKRELTWQENTAKYSAKDGYKVLTIAQSEKVFRYGSMAAGYVGAGDKCEHDPKGRTWKTLLEDCDKAPPALVVRDNYKSTLRIVYPRKNAEKALFAGPYGFTREAEKKTESAEERRKREQEERERKEREQFAKDCEKVGQLVTAAEARDVNAAFLNLIVDHLKGNGGVGALLKRRGLISAEENDYRKKEKSFADLIKGADGKKLRGIVLEIMLWHWGTSLNPDRFKTACTVFGLKFGKAKKSQTPGDEDEDAEDE